MSAELKKLVKQLQSTSTDEETIVILKSLKTDYQINEAILRESKAGLAVGKLRAHASKDVADLAKEIVKKWKTEVEKAKGGSSSNKPGANGKTQSRKASITPTPATPSSANDTPKVRTAQSDGVKVDLTGDKTRDKCMQLIYDALAHDSGAPSHLILTRSRGIEENVLSLFGSTNTEYKSKIRTLFVNLKDKGNPGLRENVVSGEISVEKFSRMTSQDMASEERKAADSKIKEQNFLSSLGAEDQQAETDAFECSRCKQRKCRYRQAQTRSADEPMTTFVTCTVCNNRWKFS
jgi:transcription elongation factor S-II